MLTRSQVRRAQQRAAERIRRAGIAIRADEAQAIEVADLGLNELEITGLQILTVVSTANYAAKIIALEPNQLCPQHRHPPLGDYAGKEETIRCQWGELILGMPGEPTPASRARIPAHRAPYYTVRHELILHPGEQYTFPPNTWHWFQAGPEGAVVWSFSSQAFDVQDDFTDPAIRRVTEIVED
ncbi:MAG: D-lyxose/D-mannose family sugar isomerase [Chloroflexi bacterium]|nr:D-lyxose/D-mannose family sugar isomerase [Chloroflexota bacterium]